MCCCLWHLITITWKNLLMFQYIDSQKIYEPRHERKKKQQIFAYAKTKAQISFAVTAKLISAFVFTAGIVQSLVFLNLKFQASNHLLWKHRPVCVRHGRNSRRQVFLRPSSYDTSDLSVDLDMISLSTYYIL